MSAAPDRIPFYVDGHLVNGPPKPNPQLEKILSSFNGEFVQSEAGGPVSYIYNGKAYVAKRPCKDTPVIIPVEVYDNLVPLVPQTPKPSPDPNTPPQSPDLGNFPVLERQPWYRTVEECKTCNPTKSDTFQTYPGCAAGQTVYPWAESCNVAGPTTDNNTPYNYYVLPDGTVWITIPGKCEWRVLSLDIYEGQFITSQSGYNQLIISKNNGGQMPMVAYVHNGRAYQLQELKYCPKVVDMITTLPDQVFGALNLDPYTMQPYNDNQPFYDFKTCGTCTPLQDSYTYNSPTDTPWVGEQCKTNQSPSNTDVILVDGSRWIQTDNGDGTYTWATCNPRNEVYSYKVVNQPTTPWPQECAPTMATSENGQVYTFPSPGSGKWAMQANTVSGENYNVFYNCDLSALTYPMNSCSSYTTSEKQYKTVEVPIEEDYTKLQSLFHHGETQHIVGYKDETAGRTISVSKQKVEYPWGLSATSDCVVQVIKDPEDSTGNKQIIEVSNGKYYFLQASNYTNPCTDPYTWVQVNLANFNRKFVRKNANSTVLVFISEGQVYAATPDAWKDCLDYTLVSTDDYHSRLYSLLGLPADSDDLKQYTPFVAASFGCTSGTAEVEPFLPQYPTTIPNWLKHPNRKMEIALTVFFIGLLLFFYFVPKS